MATKTSPTPSAPVLTTAVEHLMGSIVTCVRQGHSLRRTGTHDVVWTGQAWEAADPSMRGLSVCSSLVVYPWRKPAVPDARYVDSVYWQLFHLVAMPQGKREVLKRVVETFQRGLQGTKTAFRYPEEYNYFRIWNLGYQLWTAIERANMDRC